MKVLVVDDEKQFADLLVQYLSMQGHNVEAAFDGKTALKKCESGEFDVFILDLFMPDVDGFELITELKRNYPDPKIIVMSGMSRFGSDFLGAAEKLGAYVALPKPFDLAQLSAEMEKIME